MRGIVAAVGALAGAMGTLAAQQPPPGPDIVVEARPPILTGGQWTFDQSAGLSATAPGKAWQSVRPRRWSVCIADGDTAAVVAQLVGGAPTLSEREMCGRMSVRIDGRSVRGGQSCLAMTPVGGMTRTLRFTAQLSDERMDIRYRSRTALAAGDTPPSGSEWRTIATRGGTCTPARTKAPAPIPTPVPPLALPASAPVEPVEHPPIDAAPRPAPPPEAKPDDIVVVGRRLRQLRLHYASDGRLLHWCHADVSSGSARIDRIGCAILRACVREGNDDKASALACFGRKVDEIDPRPPVALPTD